MELLCPNCQKKLTVPEQYAGQIMRCPLCQGTFNVPSIPSTVAAESAGPVGFYTPPPKAETPAVAPDVAAADAPGLPPISAETPSAASAAAPSGPSAGYSRVCAIKFNPQVVQWLPLGLVLGCLFTFFPWIFGQTVGVAGISISTPGMNAWDIGFGKTVDNNKLMEGHVFIAIFDIIIILAALLSIASLVISLNVVPDLPALKPVTPFRSLIVGGVGGLAWLCFTLQCVIGLFGRPFALQLFGALAWWVSTIAVAGAFIEFWLEQRRSGKPAPRMSMEW